MVFIIIIPGVSNAIGKILLKLQNLFLKQSHFSFRAFWKLTHYLFQFVDESWPYPSTDH